MGGVPVQNFRQMHRDAVVEQSGRAREPGSGGRLAAFPIHRRVGLAERRKHPGPGRAVVVGRFPARVLVPGVAAGVRTVGIVQQFAVPPHLQGNRHRPVGQTANGAGRQQLLAGVQDGTGHGRVRDRPQGEGVELIGTQRVVGGRLGRAPSRGRVQTIGQEPAFRRKKALRQGRSDLLRQPIPILGIFRIDPENSEDWDGLTEKVRTALAERFFSAERGFLSDCLHAAPGRGAAEATPDDALRPNQLYALTLGAITDPAMACSILDACEELLAPGAIRSLADRPVSVPLEVRRDGELLNDPHRPYAGRYAGDEDTRRKPAYHNGTAWTWVFPAFCEAYAAVYGKGGQPAARAWLAGATRLLNDGVAMHLPEILDGDAPHAPKGCDAQAWGASELARVWRMLSPDRDGEAPRR